MRPYTTNSTNMACMGPWWFSVWFSLWATLDFFGAHPQNSNEFLRPQEKVAKFNEKNYRVVCIIQDTKKNLSFPFFILSLVFPVSYYTHT